MGLNGDTIGIAKYLQLRKEVVYIFDGKVDGLRKHKEFIFLDQAFVDALDTKLKVYTYEPPYKGPQFLSIRDD